MKLFKVVPARDKLLEAECHWNTMFIHISHSCRTANRELICIAGAPVSTYARSLESA
jgi:hypothetical protein